MKRIVVFFLFWIFYADALAQIRIDDTFESTTLENQMSIFRDSTNSITISEILKSNQVLPFILITKPSPSFGYDSSHFWIHFKIKNVSTQKQVFYLRMYRTAPEKAFFYLCSKNKILNKNNFSWKTPFYKRNNQSKITSTQFEIDPKIEYDVYCLFQNKWNIVNFGIEIYSKKSYFWREFIENFNYGILTGGVFFAILMALYLFKESRESIYLYYSCYSAFSALSVLGLDGVLTHIFGHRTTYSVFTGPQSYQLYIIGTVIFNILFTHEFLEINNKGPKWLVFLGRITIIIFTVFLILIIIESRLIINFRFIYLYLLYGPIIILSLFIALKRKKILVKFYLFAFLPLNILMLCILASEARIINTSILLPYISIGILFEIFVLLIGLAYRLYDFQRQKQKLESEIIFQNLKAQETERNRIAQDLHDEVGNALAALKNLVAYNNYDLGNKFNKIAQDVRNISHNLASIDFDKTTLSLAFQNLIHRQNEAQTIVYELIEAGIPQNLSSDKSLVIYRIACELLNNIQKHSKAKKAIVQLIYESDMLTLMVEDDGIGIQSKGNKADGIGLNHIQARVAYLHGKLTIDDDGKGTIIIINIPIEKKA